MNDQIDKCQVKFNKNKVQLNNNYVKLNLTKIMSETFGDYLKEKRLALRYSQDDVADISGVSKTTISLLETNQIPQPRFNTLFKIAKALRLHKDEVRQKLTEWQSGAATTVQKPTNPAEFFDALDRLGLDIQFAGGRKVLENLDEDDLQELLDTVIASATAKGRRKQQART